MSKQRFWLYQRDGGVCYLQDSQTGDLKSAIEVVRQIPGVSASVDALAIRTEWNGNTIRVMDPISLLACKRELVASVPQEKRRDVQHLKPNALLMGEIFLISLGEFKKIS